VAGQVGRVPVEDGEVGAADWGRVVPALGAAPVDPCGAAAAQAASAASKTAMPAGARSLVYLRVREPPKERCGFNRHYNLPDVPEDAEDI
jgi:hypothetical protein